MDALSRTVLTFLLNSLWQIPLALAIAALACRTMRSGPAAHRHVVWLAALAAGIAMPLASVRTATTSAAPQLAMTYSPQIAPADTKPSAPRPATAATAAASERRTVPFPQVTATLIVFAYAAFLLLQFGRLARAWARTVALRRDAVDGILPDQAARVWARCMHAFGLRKARLLVSPTAPSPLTVGNMVVLPESLLADSTEDVLATAIAHELAHIARGDFVLSVISQFLYAPIAFHPAAWWVRRRLEGTREIACDELVTRRVLDPGVYARSIVTIAGKMCQVANPGYTLGVFDGDVLEQRIRRLLDRRVANLKRARLYVATGVAAVVVCAIVASGLALTARAQSGSYGEMKLAETAYNSGDFKTAAEHFEAAVRLDPANTNARLFLANALMRQFFAEKAPPESPLMQRARHQFQEVLANDPGNVPAMRGMVAVAIDTRRPQDAREWAMRLIQADATDKSAYYTAGVLDWSSVFPQYQRIKQAAGGKPEEYRIADPIVRKQLRDSFSSQVEDGLRLLETAVRLDPEYDDALAYMNLMYRLKAGMVDSEAESAQLMEEADNLVRRALAIKKQHAGRGSAAATRLDVSGAAPGPASPDAAVASPPPPPPPPSRNPGETELASAAPPPAPRNQVESPAPFWQVVGNSEMPAMQLFKLLRDKGFSASMLKLTQDEKVRVMVGPYFDQLSLAEAKGKLEQAGFRPLRVW